MANESALSYNFVIIKVVLHALNYLIVFVSFASYEYHISLSC